MSPQVDPSRVPCEFQPENKQAVILDRLLVSLGGSIAANAQSKPCGETESWNPHFDASATTSLTRRIEW
jgi:hypothetical protein